MNRLIAFSMIVTSLFVLSACDSGIEVTFELDGETYESEVLKEPGKVSKKPIPARDNQHFFGWFESDAYEERFNFETRITEDTTLYGKFYEGTSDTPITDSLTLEPSDYEGKTFEADGIQEVSLMRCTDGDTAAFTGVGAVRYLNIDTPESTGTVEEWGFAASEHMCDMLESAETIVVESEPNPAVGKYDSTGTRTLGYVWADGRLTNLEMIERGYSQVISAPLSQYGDLMQIANQNASNLGLRVHGQDDPSFDPTQVEVTIEQLVNNPDEYVDHFVNIEGWVTAYGNSNLTLTASNEANDGPATGGPSVSIYTAYENSANFTVGYKLRIENLYYKSSGELVNLPKADVEALIYD
jgi:endonuclease YncB( thermonuclease family)